MPVTRIPRPFNDNTLYHAHPVGSITGLGAIVDGINDLIEALDGRVETLEEAPGGGGGGTTWLTGSGAPSNGSGSVGNWYLDTTNRIAYEKTGASAWTERIRQLSNAYDGGNSTAIHSATPGTAIDGGSS